LQERVIRRAAELLSEWHPAMPPEQEPTAAGRTRQQDKREETPTRTIAGEGNTNQNALFDIGDREPDHSLANKFAIPSTTPETLDADLLGNHLRTIDDVTRIELRAAIYQAIPISGSVERDELLRTVTSLIGLSRLGRKIRSRINKTIAAEVRSGRLKTDWKTVSRVSQ